MLRSWNDPIIGPALQYAETLYPEDVGLPSDFACVIWLAFSNVMSSLYTGTVSIGLRCK